MSSSIFDKNAAQKLIAYSLIGYIKALLDYGHFETDMNFIFQPLVTAKEMIQLGYDNRLVDAMLEIDELETIYKFGDQKPFQTAAKRIADNLASVITQVHVSNYNSKASIKKLLWAETD